MSTDRKGFTMKARSLIVAAVAAATLALAGTASADVSKPDSNTWTGLHASNLKGWNSKSWDYFRPGSAKSWDVYSRPQASKVWRARL
jgi:hypothetical protein